MSQRLTAEQIEGLRHSIKDAANEADSPMTDEEIDALCDAAKRSLQIPEEPTLEMCKAAQVAEHGHSIGTMGFGHYAMIYRAMLRAGK